MGGRQLGVQAQQLGAQALEGLEEGLAGALGQGLEGQAHRWALAQALEGLLQPRRQPFGLVGQRRHPRTHGGQPGGEVGGWSRLLDQRLLDLALVAVAGELLKKRVGGLQDDRHDDELVEARHSASLGAGGAAGRLGPGR